MERERDNKGHFLPKHNGRFERLYNVWCAMKERCYNPHNKRFKNYGLKGIKVCAEWHDYAVFREWAKSTGYKEVDDYKEKLTIDRIDPNGNYEPNNCRWITPREQNRNYSKNHFITYKGKTLCITDWEKETGINRATILYRVKNGKSLEEIFKKGDMRYGR